MQVNEKRQARQLQILRKWSAAGCRGTLEACTGFGKTYTAIMAIQALNKQQPGQSTLIVVPTVHLKKQWIDQVKDLDNVTVLVVNTAVKYEHDVNLLVLDEIHNYASAVFSTLFEKVKYRKVLGLTATITRQDGNDYLLRQKAPIFDKVSLDEAMKEGYVSPFRVINVPVYLTDDDKRLYKELSQKFTYYFSKFGHDFGQAMNCLKSEQACENFARRTTATAEEVRIWAINFNRNLAARKKMLYNNRAKVDACVRLINQLDMKTITFSESVDFANALTNYTPKVSMSYSSRLGKKKRREVIQSFNDDDIRVINTAKALDEGFDVPGVELAIISSGSSSPRQDVQRTGRAIRFVEGKVGYIINLYMPDTQDEKWLRARQKKSINVEWHQSIDDVLYIIAGVQAETDSNYDATTLFS